MSEIRDRVEKKIDEYLVQTRISPGSVPQFREAILSIPELAIVDREAELPENPHKPRQFEYQSKHWFRADEDRQIYNQAQQDMLKAGWVKEIRV